MATNKPVLFYAIPTYDNSYIGDVMDGYYDGVNGGVEHIPHSKMKVSGSLLANVFNRLWAECFTHNVRVDAGIEVNHPRFTHFLMNHADIYVNDGGGWIHKMLKIMEDKRLDVLSVNSPIKTSTVNGVGDTSTAVMIGDKIRRLKLEELAKLPETITPADTLQEYGSDKLLINTGVMLVDLARIDPTKQYFHITDGMKRMDNKALFVDVLSEDWNFSMMLNKAGLRYGATRAIKLLHYGQAVWGNQHEV